MFGFGKKKKDTYDKDLFLRDLKVYNPGSDEPLEIEDWDKFMDELAEEKENSASNEPVKTIKTVEPVPQPNTAAKESDAIASIEEIANFFRTQDTIINNLVAYIEIMKEYNQGLLDKKLLPKHEKQILETILASSDRVMSYVKPGSAYDQVRQIILG